MQGRGRLGDSPQCANQKRDKFMLMLDTLVVVVVVYSIHQKDNGNILSFCKVECNCKISIHLSESKINFYFCCHQKSPQCTNGHLYVMDSSSDV